ncbi:MAG: FG-GAP repeat domain-containing protein [Nitrososphaerota archaeon]
MCSGGPNEGVYNYSPEGKIQAPAEIDNHAWGENTVFGFVGDCSSPCGGSGEESGGGSEPPVPPQEPQPEVAVYRYMLGTSAGESIASWGTMLTGMSEAKAMSLGDMTGDGKSDIVSVEPEGTGSYRYMLGTSAGENIASWSKILGGMSVPIRLGVGDFTGDGKADILALESEGNGQYRYMLGTSNGGGVSSWKKILGGMSEAKLMSVGDFTGDGKADILALESEGNGKYRYMLGVSSGAGISSWKQVLGGMSEAKAMSVRDMTGDGKADIISVEPEGNGHYRYMLGRSSGGGVATWKQVLGGMSEPKAMSAGDFTGDGKADIVSVEKEE